MTIKAISARNQIKGRIRRISLGEVLSEVDVRTTGGATVTATLNTRSIRELGLNVGSRILVLIRESRVAIATSAEE